MAFNSGKATASHLPMGLSKLKVASSEIHDTKRDDSRGPSFPLRELVLEGGNVLKEEAFRTLLLLERRRAERSRKPFILMLLTLPPASKKREALGEVGDVLAKFIRESDLIGWYEHEAVLGVIFTEIGSGSSGGSVVDTLKSKVLAALGENLDPSMALELVLTFHLFPEKWDKERPDGGADVKLYPDIHEQRSNKRIPRVVKRAIDIAGSTILLAILAPLLAVIAVAIKLTSRGPVIFKQERLGQFGKQFDCLKFRSMYTDNDPGIHRDYVQNLIAGKAGSNNDQASSGVYKITNDPRVTPVGRILRKASLDELPQFWNVVRGDMSLVGPRPPVRYEFEVYDFWHRRRVIEAKPGVTGLWQVSARSRTSFDDMVRLDLRYSQEWSLWLDLKILLATPFAVFTGDGAF
jgi:lipopolysaccharide/colanic/teichoic acid biosynthesis glycosyltransferase